MDILVLTAWPTSERAQRVLPALDLLVHPVRFAGHDPQAPAAGPAPDAVLVDARSELAGARDTCRLLRAAGPRVPLLVVVEESGLVAVSTDWGFDDVVLTSAGPTEVEARLRLAAARTTATRTGLTDGMINVGELVINPNTYAVRLKGAPLDLTYKEFELLRFLAQHPGRVFTRDHLLREVWGFDYFGGHRTVDVHVRRLRAKLGSEYESMIGTVRQVGYKLVLQPLPETHPALTELETLLA